MNQHSNAIIHRKSGLGYFTSIFFGILFMAIGIINTFWGNDPQFGIFIILLSFLYFPPVTRLIKNKIGFSVSTVLKLVIGAFIIWAAMGVGELFDKIDLMLADLN